MPVPSSINDLSVTSSSNSPAGTDSIGTSLDDYLRSIQAILKESGASLYTATGSDTLTFSTTPSFATYTTGQRFTIVSAGANTGAMTLNINSLGAKNIYKNGSSAMEASDIPGAGYVFTVVYDGTQFQIVSGSGGGAKAGGVIHENSTTIAANYTLTTGKNGFSVGAITINSGVTVTVPSGQRWVVM